MRLTAWALVLATGCLRLPVGPDTTTRDVFVPRAPGPAVEVIPLLMASDKQPLCAVAGEATCFARVPVVHAAYLVRHGATAFLIDAGLSAHAKEDLARFSWSARQALKFTQRQTLAQALAGTQVDFVLLTHVHWDHTSGIQDLPGVRVVLSTADLDYLAAFRGKEPLVVPGHLKDARVDSFAWDGPPYESFSASHDLFADGSVMLVPLPGHTPGSTGVFLTNVHGRRFFFVGDTVWAREGIDIPSHRAEPLSRVVDADVAALSASLWRVRHLVERYPDIVVVPTHDGRALDEVRKLTE